MTLAPRNIVLAVVLLGLVVALFTGGREVGPTREIVRLVPDLVPSEATSIELRARDKRVQLRREEGQWVLTELYGYPADGRLVERILARLADLSTLDLLSEDGARHGEYGLDEASAQRVVVTGPDDATVADLFLARSSTGTAFVRRFGEDAVYGAGALPTTSSELQAWRRSTPVIPLEAGMVRRIELKGPALGPGERTLVLERDTNNYHRWSDGAGRDLPREATERLVGEVVGAFPERVLAAEGAPEHGLAAPRLEVTAEGVDGAVHVARFGAELSDGAVAAVGATGPWVVAVRGTALERIADSARALLR